MSCHRDIVDVKHINGSVKSIMMGSLSQAVDDEPDDSGDDDYVVPKC